MTPRSRSRPACDVLGCTCGCHRQKQRRPPVLWTPEMDEMLTTLLRRGEHPRGIAAVLFLYEGSIRWRIKQLGLSVRDGWRSRQEVAAVLGVSRRSVDRWMRDGRLTVTSHGRRWTRTSEAELAGFIRRYAGLLFEATTVSDPALRRLAETSSIVNRRSA